MSTTYTPTAAENTSYTAAADGDNDNAAAFNVWLEGLSDMAEFLRRGGVSQVFNWPNTAATTRNLKRCAWSEKQQAWYGVGDGGNDFVEVSFDNGKSWVDRTGTIGLTSTLALLDLAFAPSGECCILAGGSRTVYDGSMAASVISFTARANAVSVAPSGGTIAYDESAALWIACYRNGASGHVLETSPDAQTFTVRTLPVAWTGYTGSKNPEVASSGGISIAAFLGTAASDTPQIIYSSNATAWSAGTITKNSGITPVGITKASYDSINDEWYVAIWQTSTRRTEVFRSTDNGATWTSVAYMGAVDIALVAIAHVGGALVGIDDDGRIAFSTDRGVTWKWATWIPQSSAAQPGMAAGGGGLCVVNSASQTAYTSLRVGGTGVVVA